MVAFRSILFYFHLILTALDNASQYSNWATGEPNNAGGHEGCAVQNLKELSGSLLSFFLFVSVSFLTFLYLCICIFVLSFLIAFYSHSPGWNDVHCLSHQAHIVVEYGKTVVPCPQVPEHEKVHEKYDPNFKFIPQEEVDL
jgi:hypothetical protein